MSRYKTIAFQYGGSTEENSVLVQLASHADLVEFMEEVKDTQRDVFIDVIGDKEKKKRPREETATEERQRELLDMEYRSRPVDDYENEVICILDMFEDAFMTLLRQELCVRRRDASPVRRYTEAAIYKATIVWETRFFTRRNQHPEMNSLIRSYLYPDMYGFVDQKDTSS